VSPVDIVARTLSRLGLKALRQALKRLPPSERLTVLNEVQKRVLKTLGDDEASFLRRYAAKTMETCLARVSPPEQSEIITGATRRALECMDRNYVFDTCASLTNMSNIHPRMVDPASFTATAGDLRPLVVGPWLMEIGFELLYWIPYLRAQLAQLGIPRHRVIAISRGGAAGWYGDIAGRYLDILDVMTPQEFHDWTSGAESGDILEGNRKPFNASPLETTILDRVLQRANIDDYQVIMPSAMYGLLRNVWCARFASHKVNLLLAPALLDRPEPLELPFQGPYVAVKFYHSRTFPGSTELNNFARHVVRNLARRSNVVVLSNAARLDDHDTLSMGRADGPHRVFDASGLYTPRNNLAVQTALVAHADELHGTYGGFSYLGPLLGIDTVAYTGTCDFTITHLDLAWTTFDRIGGGQLTLVPVRDGAPEVFEQEQEKGFSPKTSRREQNAYPV
jgi:hypothetical protein